MQISSNSKMAAIIAGAASLTLILAMGSPAYAAKKFKNCTDLNKVHPHGVAKTGYSDLGGGLTGIPTINNKLYKANKTKDRDHDGIACEK